MGIVGALLLASAPLAAGEGVPAAPSHYAYASEHDPDGIGKFYYGREIARVMGHPGIRWLERPGREQEERPDRLIQLLRVKAGDVVADVGAGSGYHARRLARAVGNQGKVYAVDIQPEMLTELSRRMQRSGITNVVPVLATDFDPRLPAQAVDLAVLVDVYHELEHPFEVMQAICTSLKPGGRVVLVEFRANDSQVPIKPLHTMTEAQVRKEMAIHPLTWVETLDELPWQQVVVFRRISPGAGPGPQSSN